MAEPDAKGGPRVVRIPVTRPLVTALSMVALGTALLVGGGADNASTVSARPTAPAAPRASTPIRPADWDVTPRDLVVGDRTSSVVAVDQILAGPLQIDTLAAALQAANFDPSWTARQAGGTSVPVILWNAYRSAVASAPRSCHLPVQLLAAIGQVESGSLAGRGLDSRHRAVPAVFGPVLDGNGFAAIRDTDGGRWDGNATWDRAVGPMQFIPSTWQRWGRDGNSDGVSDPQNVEDSAWSAAAYLCAGGRDLSTRAGLRSAILSYNHSDVYLADVLRLMRTVSAGGTLPRSVMWRSTPPPFVGPPSTPPVRAAPRPVPSTSSASTGSRPRTRTASTTPPGTTTSTTPTSTTSPTPTTTATSATATTSTTASPTSTPPGSSTTSSSTTAGTPTQGASECPTPSTTPTTGVPTPAQTTTPDATSTGDQTSPSAATSTTTATSTTSRPTTSTTTDGQPQDPCLAPVSPTTSGLKIAKAISMVWPDQGTISNLTVLVLMLASMSLTLTVVPSWFWPLAFARTAGS